MASAVWEEAGLLPADLLPSSILRGLQDKLYDRRKTAALDLERWTRSQSTTEGGDGLWRQAILLLTRDLTYSLNPHARNGGLIGLAAMAIAIGADVPHFLYFKQDATKRLKGTKKRIGDFISVLMPPVLALLGDSDARVRYYACESMYNMCKVTKRGESLLFFNEVFDALSRLSADPEVSVKNGAEMLDRLVKETVADQAAAYRTQQRALDALVATGESGAPVTVLQREPNGREAVMVQATPHPVFTLHRFMPLLKERLNVINPFTRSFLITWLAVLETLPSLDLLSYLPDFLPALFTYTGDRHDDVRIAAIELLGDLLKDIQDVVLVREEGARPAPTIQWAAILQIVLSHLNASTPSTQATALMWISDLAVLAPKETLAFLPDVVRLIFPSLAMSMPIEILSLARSAQKNVQATLTSADTTPAAFGYAETVHALVGHVKHPQEETRVASVAWLFLLQQKDPRLFRPLLPSLFPHLILLLSDKSEAVLAETLTLLGQLAEDEALSFLHHLLDELLLLFQKDHRLLEHQGATIICRLCAKIGAAAIFGAFADILQDYGDILFASDFIRYLNILLMNSEDCAGLRTTLRSLADPPAKALFLKMYTTWCHNAISTLGLCLITGAYKHGARIVAELCHVELTVPMLVQLDKLIHMVESAPLTYMRLQLLEPLAYPHLYKCLYGILMILPQSTMWGRLRDRLTAAGGSNWLGPVWAQPFPNTPPLHEEGKEVVEVAGGDPEALMTHFRAMQAAQTAARKNVDTTTARHRLSQASTHSQRSMVEEGEAKKMYRSSSAQPEHPLSLTSSASKHSPVHRASTPDVLTTSSSTPATEPKLVSRSSVLKRLGLRDTMSSVRSVHHASSRRNSLR